MLGSKALKLSGFSTSDEIISSGDYNRNLFTSRICYALIACEKQLLIDGAKLICPKISPISIISNLH
jgi:hypothetical protein